MTECGAVLLTLPLLTRMRQVPGWLEDDEADLLIAATARALLTLPPPHAVVEIGSYCGRSTVGLGRVVKTLRPEARVYGIDPHEGEVGATGEHVYQGTPTLDAFRWHIEQAGVQDVVETVQQRSYEVTWSRPISFLLIDGLHDYGNVARDFHHFAPWLAPGALVAFHDYADYYPGVKRLVHEVLQSGRYQQMCLIRSLIVIQQLA